MLLSLIPVKCHMPCQMPRWRSVSVEQDVSILSVCHRALETIFLNALTCLISSILTPFDSTRELQSCIETQVRWKDPVCISKEKNQKWRSKSWLNLVNWESVYILGQKSSRAWQKRTEGEGERRSVVMGFPLNFIMLWLLHLPERILTHCSLLWV